MDSIAFFKSIVETIREPLLVLDEELRVMLANRAFFRTFKVGAPETLNAYIFELGNGQWNIPDLRKLLLEIIPQNDSFEDFAITHDFPQVGTRSMLLNARKLYRPGNHTETILLAFEDVTERNKLMLRLQMSITETHHQVKNSLNVVLMMLTLQIRKREVVPVEEIRKLIDHIKGYAALHEMLTIQTKQKDQDKVLEVKPILEELVKVLQIGFAENKIQSDIDSLRLSSRLCSSLAVIANELVTNSIKQGATRIDLELKQTGNLAHFSICDDGKGFPEGFQPDWSKGVGFNLTQELCRMDFDAPLKFENLPRGGSCVSIDFALPI